MIFRLAIAAAACAASLAAWAQMRKPHAAPMLSSPIESASKSDAGDVADLAAGARSAPIDRATPGERKVRVILSSPYASSAE